MNYRSLISYSLIASAIIFNFLLVLFLFSSFSASQYSVSAPIVPDSTYLSPNYIDDFFHTDALTQYHFFMGMENGNKLSDWQISTVNHYFPIIPLYGICYFALKNPGASLLMYILAQLGLILFLFAWLAKQVAPKYWAQSSVIGILMLSIFFLYPLYIPDVCINANLLMPYHSGMFISFLLSLVFLLKTLMNADKKANYILLSISIVLATISNPLFHAYFTLPSLALVGLLAIRDFKRQLPVIAAVIGSFVFGKLLILVIPDMTHSLGFSSAHLQSYEIMKMTLQTMYERSLLTQLILIVTAASFLYSIVFACIALYKQKIFLCKTSFTTYEQYHLFTVALLLSGLSAPIYAGIFLDPSAIRYILYLMLFGIFNVGIIAGYYSAHKSGKSIKIATVIMLCSAAIFVANRSIGQNPFSAFVRMSNYTSTLAVAVDHLAAKYPIKDGVGDFWDAKQATVFSKKNIKLLHVYKGLGPYALSSCITDFREDAPGKTAYFNFIILRNWGDTTSVYEIFGDSIVRATEGDIRFYLVPEFTYNDSYELQFTGKFDFSEELQLQKIKDSVSLTNSKF